jgi:hypothetical protein
MIIFTTIMSWLGNLLGGPFAKAAVEAYGKKLDAENSRDAKVAELAGRELTVREKERELSVKLSTSVAWYHPSSLMGYSLAIFFAKCVIWDKVLGLGSTDALRGDLQIWAQSIIYAYFGSYTVITAARVIRGK